MTDIAISSKFDRVLNAVAKFWTLDPSSRRMRADLAITKKMCVALSGSNVTVEDILRFQKHYAATADREHWSAKDHSTPRNRLRRAQRTARFQLADCITVHIGSLEFLHHCLLRLQALVANEPIPAVPVFALDARVVFEVFSGIASDHDCIHFLLPRLLVESREGVSILQAPYWVYFALALLAANSAPGSVREPRDSQLLVGAVWPWSPPDILEAACSLWDPEPGVTYQSFGTALAAAAALA